jgi:hypothetical protein
MPAGKLCRHSYRNGRQAACPSGQARRSAGAHTAGDRPLGLPELIEAYQYSQASSRNVPLVCAGRDFAPGTDAGAALEGALGGNAIAIGEVPDDTARQVRRPPCRHIRRGPWGHLWADDPRVAEMADWRIRSLMDLPSLVTQGQFKIT